jgi:hypothetical protein
MRTRAQVWDLEPAGERGAGGRLGSTQPGKVVAREQLRQLADEKLALSGVGELAASRCPAGAMEKAPRFRLASLGH